MIQDNAPPRLLDHGISIGTVVADSENTTSARTDAKKNSRVRLISHINFYLPTAVAEIYGEILAR